MSLPEFWFVLIGVLFTGYFVLEGFDFGVGMLMPILGRGDETRKRVVLNTIGPVWDGNEVWLITGGGAMFAAFPEWYASLFSGFYLALLLILVALIVRAVAIEYRGKINDPRWRRGCDAAIVFGSWVPALAWGLAFANLVHGVRLNAHKQVEGGLLHLLVPYALLGAVALTLLFLLHGAVFIGLKTGGEVRAGAERIAKLILAPTVAVVAAFGLWTQLEYGKGWTWIVLALAVIGLLLAGASVYRGRDGWAFTGTALTVVAAVVLLFGALFPYVMPSTLDPALGLSVDGRMVDGHPTVSATSTHYTLVVMSWVAVVLTPLVVLYQGWTYWVFRQRITVEQIPAPIGLPLSRTSA
ncbi:cytochrome d ubiquinol oxidase subunit II [Nocardia terpenica]|uniref:cytochrome d ubiquinol oxidase subunit II n=1 Tax=Nocardia terpenica TaxID=455432 RepID=UPI00189613B1|nr:cytochrome d ubiquinol oxidase subunit II [Nocardia terpenica]MBF6062267.1 cytochrome d ubiquinol oxidase subunit II [Nocardia terpenica]MBF6104355.1 cytochrome d ubiquinol oxidase subunit II [Nocardia terpenica]MBF6109789.1 cytochrome d ubiquinol oxidase subunit II [Nocardia terpenica]MBF6120095.1 cytochrome d ubiquinol oxidase subunit II [Nocardia terpenica]MBF6152506.1 cytochrome d ubiquinol oxidase subunit II [Nocardia terpenica]